MIVVKLTGGLGNQLFQYAIGRYISIAANSELVLEDSFYYDVPPNSTPRTFELDKFMISGRRTDAEERRALRSYSGRVWKRLRRAMPLPGGLQYVHEPVGQFLSSARNLKDNVFLDGYWQSADYFAGVESVLRNELKPLTPMSIADQQVARHMEQVQSVSLHVRRGDYVSNASAQKVHGLCGLSYYEAAVGFMAERLKNPVFFMFSDDLDWLRANLLIDHPCVYVGHNTSDLAVQDLRLMSCAKHHIIANSSFSWWAAWLNPSPAKLVVRPKKWYVGLPEAGDQTCPSDWTAM